ncbi:hypothetical protein Hokovirus_3_291 [Hokovirus HKV1]|uniref:Uncharacterized protein n=1 Tax=Hokovirus HKV1 TaxID=1977638 RepID=A0A1V0SH98_9VIRU|nr:hypothetical protein Hokovirus_3_291 [Hokovirus HKV1]
MNVRSVKSVVANDITVKSALKWFFNPYSCDHKTEKRFYKNLLYGITMCTSFYICFLIGDKNYYGVPVLATVLTGLAYWRPKNFIAMGLGIAINQAYVACLNYF